MEAYYSSNDALRHVRFLVMDIQMEPEESNASKSKGGRARCALGKTFVSSPFVNINTGN